MATEPVAWLVAVTFAFGIEAPVGSTTAPVMAPCSTWARQTNALVAKSNDAVSNALFRDILAPLRTANAPRLSYNRPEPTLEQRPCAIEQYSAKLAEAFTINRSNVRWPPKALLNAHQLYSQKRPVSTLD